jgi:hypothetical protein
MLRRKPSKIEVKTDDREEIAQLREQQLLQQEQESGILSPLFPPTSSAAIHRNLRTTQLDPADKARLLGIDES